jgi:hypothetical protein
MSWAGGSAGVAPPFFASAVSTRVYSAQSDLRASVRHTAFSGFPQTPLGQVRFNLTSPCSQLNGRHPRPVNACSSSAASRAPGWPSQAPGADGRLQERPQEPVLPLGPSHRPLALAVGPHSPSAGPAALGNRSGCLAGCEPGLVPALPPWQSRWHPGRLGRVRPGTGPGPFSTSDRPGDTRQRAWPGEGPR